MSVEEIIKTKLTEGLEPDRLEVVNISHQHAGHASSPGTGESHFEVAVVSKAFSGLPKVARFRLVHNLLKEEMKERIHALSLDLKAPDDKG